MQMTFRPANFSIENLQIGNIDEKVTLKQKKEFFLFLFWVDMLLFVICREKLFEIESISH